ncbi:MAG: leucine-rich repeat domain-containing protein, partial [Bacteroidales bacterium]|nr:leucine-rich repeat domain-containing protein [Bacteroidales bacterium]
MAQKKSVTIDCGGLEKALAGDYSFTTLVVNGSMDVRDFACINDNVMTLESIDLSGCTIQSYDSRDEQYLGAHSHFVAGEIPPSAFLGFPNLTTVVLPSSLRSIGEGAFAGCESLVSVKNGSSIEQIGNFSFSGCASLCEMELPATLRCIGDY